MCRSIHERNPKEAQLEQEEKIQHQTLTSILQDVKLILFSSTLIHSLITWQ